MKEAPGTKPAARGPRRGELLEVEIDSLAFGGNGVARLALEDGRSFVVFVRAGLPGDTVRARVTKVQRRHAEAIATAVLEPGPVRVEAPCKHYPACGGCRFQDLAYGIRGHEVEFQQLGLIDTFVPVGVFPGIAGEGIHVMEEPVCGHHYQLILAGVVADERKRERDIQLRGIVALGKDGKGCKAGIVFQTVAKSRPEPAPGNDLTVRTPGVMVGADGGAGCHIALSHHQRCA